MKNPLNLLENIIRRVIDSFPVRYSTSACKLEMIDDVEHPSYLRFIFTDHRVVPSLPMHSHRR